MQNLLSRAHLPAVKFSPRAFMGCGGWDLAQAPQVAAPSMEDQIQMRGSSTFSRPRRTMGCGGGGFPSMPEELVEPDELSGGRLACGGGGYQPDFMKEEEDGPIVTLKPGLSGRARRPQVTMGCGDEPCEACKAAAAEAGMGCPKCKRIRQRAMNQDELDGANRMGQSSGLPDMSVLVVSSLTVAGLFYLATR